MSGLEYTGAWDSMEAVRSALAEAEYNIDKKEKITSATIRCLLGSLRYLDWLRKAGVNIYVDNPAIQTLYFRVAFLLGGIIGKTNAADIGPMLRMDVTEVALDAFRCNQQTLAKAQLEEEQIKLILDLAKEGTRKSERCPRGSFGLSKGEAAKGSTGSKWTHSTPQSGSSSFTDIKSKSAIKNEVADPRSASVARPGACSALKMDAHSSSFGDIGRNVRSHSNLQSPTGLPTRFCSNIPNRTSEPNSDEVREVVVRSSNLEMSTDSEDSLMASMPLAEEEGVPGPVAPSGGLVDQEDRTRPLEPNNQQLRAVEVANSNLDMSTDSQDSLLANMLLEEEDRVSGPPAPSGALVEEEAAEGSEAEDSEGGEAEDPENPVDEGESVDSSEGDCRGVVGDLINEVCSEESDADEHGDLAGFIVHEEDNGARRKRKRVRFVDSSDE